MDIVEFDPATAPVADLQDVFEVVAAANAVDNPDLPPATFDSVVGALRSPQPNLAPARYWLARKDDRVVVLAILYFPQAENRALSLMKLVVHPEFRRGGIGTVVLRELVPELRGDGRKTVEYWNLPKGSGGEAFGATHGFRVVCSTVFQRLSLDDVEVAPLPASGYRLRTWSDAAPDDLLESYAKARQAIADSPFGQSAFRFPQWSAQRVRDAEAGSRRLKIGQRVVAAVHEGSGEVAGITELHLSPHRQDVAYQGDTAVLAEHRGHGLGYWMKADMLRWLRAEHPGFEQVFTSTGATNSHMINVNHRLGFRDAHETVVLGHDVDVLWAQRPDR